MLCYAPHLALAKLKYSVPRLRALELSRLEHGTQDSAFIVPLRVDMKMLESEIPQPTLYLPGASQGEEPSFKGNLVDSALEELHLDLIVSMVKQIDFIRLSGVTLGIGQPCQC